VGQEETGRKEQLGEKGEQEIRATGRYSNSKKKGDSGGLEAMRGRQYSNN
jgi:hypothetical protein